MRTVTVGTSHEESLAHLIWGRLAALLQLTLRRCRATADPFESGFLPV